MNHVFFTAVVTLCAASNLQAQIDRLRQPIVVPGPDSSQYNAHRNVIYREVDGRQLRADIFVPAKAGAANAAVIFVHGGPLPEDLPIEGKDLGQYQSYGALMAGAGLAGVVFTHRFTGVDAFQTATSDILAAVEFVRTNAERFSIDRDRVCLWFISAGGAFVAPFLAERPDWLKCIVVYYGVMRPGIMEELGVGEVSSEQREGLDPFPLLEAKSDWDPAFFVAEAGADAASLNAGLRRFAQTAIQNGWKVEYWNHPTGPHGFDVFADDPRSREVILRTVQFLRLQLTSDGGR